MLVSSFSCQQNAVGHRSGNGIATAGKCLCQGRHCHDTDGAAAQVPRVAAFHYLACNNTTTMTSKQQVGPINVLQNTIQPWYWQYIPKISNILPPILQIVATKIENHITQHSFIGSFFELDQAMPCLLSCYRPAFCPIHTFLYSSWPTMLFVP